MHFGRRNFKKIDTPRRLTPMERLARVLAYIISLLAATALLLTIVSPFIEPSEGGILPILGLVAPAIYITNIIIALCWIIYWRWRIALPIIIILLLGSFQSSLFIKIPLTKIYDTKSYKGMMHVMSYNVRSFYGDSGSDTERLVAQYVETERPDIICFQEFYPSEERGFNSFAPNIAKYYQASVDGLTIFSRYPIINREERVSNSDELIAGRSMMVDIAVGIDTIRVFNNHLQSTTITAHDSQYLTSHMIVRDTNRNHNIVDIISRYKASCEKRAKQADLISKLVSQSPYPTIVCGDFNDPPASYTYNKISQDLKDSFVECGNNYSYTYRGFFNLLRIDYILCSNKITPHSYKVDRKALYSDHLPVTSHLKIER